jgi:hypothetical protein
LAQLSSIYVSSPSVNSFWYTIIAQIEEYLYFKQKALNSGHVHSVAKLQEHTTDLLQLQFMTVQYKQKKIATSPAL